MMMKKGFFQSTHDKFICDDLYSSTIYFFIMANASLTREFGQSIGRLPEYDKVSVARWLRHPNTIFFKIEMRQLVSEKSTILHNGKPSSERTQKIAMEVLLEMCERITNLGYRIKRIHQIEHTHIEAAIRDHWACGASLKYLESIMTQLNKLQIWLGKPRLIQKISDYLPDVSAKEFAVKHVTAESKTWTANGIDFKQKIKHAKEIDLRFGLMLQMCEAFGLRRQEVLLICPWTDDKKFWLQVRHSSSSSRFDRSIEIKTQKQRDTLDLVKQHVKKKELLGWSDGQVNGIDLLSRNIRRYSQLMVAIGMTRKLAGVTGDGLRAQFTTSDETFPDLYIRNSSQSDPD